MAHPEAHNKNQHAAHIGTQASQSTGGANATPSAVLQGTPKTLTPNSARVEQPGQAAHLAGTALSAHEVHRRCVRGTLGR